MGGGGGGGGGGGVRGKRVGRGWFEFKCGEGREMGGRGGTGGGGGGVWTSGDFKKKSKIYSIFFRSAKLILRALPKIKNNLIRQKY